MYFEGPSNELTTASHQGVQRDLGLDPEVGRQGLGFGV